MSGEYAVQKCNPFVLIIIVFVLLIVVGCSCFHGGY
ncbi:sporulation protein YjcZ [Jeotgalibacillus marinus]|uniref:Sporulation protein YjcZ n=1 Tax=Jeotgalibacillus marinus TaxID=86667 RepID=A0ABV3Q092_9BACL